MFSPAFINDAKLNDSGIRFLTLILISTLLVACGGSESVPATHVSKDQILLSGSADKAIAIALYHDQRTPDGFYEEETPGDSFTTTRHLRNTDLMSAPNRAGVFAFDLSSDDFSQALNWSEVAASMQAGGGHLVDNDESDMYHEITRVDSVNPQFTQRHRVYKSSMIDRSGIDAHYRGRITKPGFTADDVKEIIEYQWTFTIENNYGNVVLASAVTERADDYLHQMTLARLIRSLGAECDRIEMYLVSYEVPKATGNIWKQTEYERTFSARRTGSGANLCG